MKETIEKSMSDLAHQTSQVARIIREVIDPASTNERRAECTQVEAHCGLILEHIHLEKARGQRIIECTGPIIIIQD